MELSLEQKQLQKLSPQMVQSMEILQMGALELQEYVQEQLLENPTLELEHREGLEGGQELLRKLSWLNSSDRQNRWYYQEEAKDFTELVGREEGESLADHLREQIHWQSLSPRHRAAVECVLAGLNDDGYLEESTGELARRSGLLQSIIREAEELVRGLEPAGVAARDLSECLALQLERRGETGLALTIARHHLEDVARDHYNRIAKATGAGREEIQAACRALRDLEPRPGGQFARREAPGYVVPDLLLTREGDALEVTPYQDLLPTLTISPYYRQLLESSDDAQVRRYLEEKVTQADWLIKSIRQRKDTLLSCARAIVDFQEKYLLRESAHLAPLTLADVSAVAGVHASTVSRAIRDKYIQCPRGVIPLSALFTRALPGTVGGASPEQAKAALLALLQGEDRRTPLSDQKLCDLLAGQGLTLARRTVAKYRDELGYPSAPGRREW